jgi:hypothetical protein
VTTGARASSRTYRSDRDAFGVPAGCLGWASQGVIWRVPFAHATVTSPAYRGLLVRFSECCDESRDGS